MAARKEAGYPGEPSGARGDDAAGPVVVLIVDDHRTVAEALALVLETDARIHCAGVVPSAEEALALMSQQRCDVVVMDVVLAGVGGIEGTRRIRAAHPQARVVVLTGHVEAGVLAAAVEAGASAFLPKTGPLSDVVDAILAPEDTSLIIGAHTPLRVISEAMGVRDRLQREAPTQSLTGRELDVLEMLAEGMSPAVAAEELGISLHTCRGHIKSILSKLQVHSQLEAVVAAWQRGLLRTPERHPPHG